MRPHSAVSDEFWLQVALAQMEAPGGPVYAVRLRDVTADVRTQVNVWSFHGLVNHKLRTPLSIITGFMDILTQELEAVLDEEKLFYLKTVQNSLLHFREQVLDILHYIESPESSAATPDVGREPCPLVELPALATEIGAKLEIETLRMACDVAGAAAETSVIRLPRQALELILWELLENAKKFHPRHSPTVEVTVSLADGALRLRVGDDGLTLSPEQLLKIWMPYYQAEKGFSGAVPGLGLGLTMVATQVWRVGGACRAYNRPDGPGIVVELTLPVEEADGTPQTP